MGSQHILSQEKKYDKNTPSCVKNRKSVFVVKLSRAEFATEGGYRSLLKVLRQHFLCDGQDIVR